MADFEIASIVASCNTSRGGGSRGGGVEGIATPSPSILVGYESLFFFYTVNEAPKLNSDNCNSSNLSVIYFLFYQHPNVVKKLLKPQQKISYI